jgi:undecaprenyl-diphosphatase
MKAMLKRFDTSLISLIQKIPEMYRPLMNTASFVGQPIVTIGLCLLVIAIGVIRMLYPLQRAGLIAISVIIAGQILKIILRRARPKTQFVRMMKLSTFSFPSGHALGATMAFGLLALTANGPFLIVNYMLWAIDFCIIVNVGISRVYLGAHYPTDVLAGWLFGSLGLIAIALQSGI